MLILVTIEKVDMLCIVAHLLEQRPIWGYLSSQICLCFLIRFWNYASADRAVDLSPAGVPQQMLKQYHFCGKSSNILQPSMPPEGMVQVHVWDRKLSKVRAYSV